MSFIRAGLNPYDYVLTADDNGRLIASDFVMYDISWRVICVYCPNKIREKKIFFQEAEPLHEFYLNVSPIE